MSVKRSDDSGHPTPQLRAVPGGRREPVDPAGDPEDERAHDEPDPDAVRPAKVAEARLKILNDYYSRRDIQRELAERLVYALGA